MRVGLWKCDVRHFSGRTENAVNSPRSAYRAIALIAVVCIGVVGHDLLRTWEDRSRQLASAQREAVNLTLSADQHAEDAFRIADTVLTGLVERVEVDGTEPAQRDRLRHRMLQQLSSLPGLSGLYIIDETGAPIVESEPLPRGANLGDRDYFQYHKTHRDRGSYVNTRVRSIISDKWLIGLTRRIDHPDGSFAGVVAATIDVAYFERFYATFNLGHDGAAALLRDDGTILVRQTLIGPAVGAAKVTVPPFDDPQSREKSGTGEVVGQLDGVRRIYAWRRVAGYPLVVAVGVGKDESLAGWRLGAGEHLLAAVVVALLLGATMVRLGRQVRELTRAELATAVATAAAKTAAAQYRLIADNASDMVIAVDLRFVRHYVSPGCRDLVGYEPEQLIGGTPADLLHPDDMERVTASLREVAAGRDRTALACRVRHRDGRTVWVEATMRLIRDPGSGAPLEICTALHDITARHDIEREKEQQRHELERTNADLQAFAHIASHDLKAPLRAIMHLANWIKTDISATASPETLGHLGLLVGRTERLDRLLDDLLHYSRIRRDRSAVEDLDIAELVNEIVTVSPPPPGFVIGCAPRMPRVRALRTPLRVVLDNLITNSVRHHDRLEGCVTIAVSLVDGLAEFRITDDGPGIPPRFHDRIFGIFQTLARRDDVEASGMGLAIVKKMVEVHGGQISIESDPPARGTTIVFTWQESPR